MRRFRGYWSLIVIVVLAVVALAYTFAVNNKPLLGLDLQGGVSVVLQPKGEADGEAIDEAIAIMRQRIDSLGVAEPEITRQGDNILIQIPGVKDKDRAIEQVGKTAELQFRPVLSTLPPTVVTDTTTTTADPSSTTTSADPNASTTTAPANPTGLEPDVCVTGLTVEQTNPAGEAYLPQCESSELTAVLQVGPRALTGSALSTARATLNSQNGQWVVNPVFNGGAEGIDLFNAAAAQCYPPSTTCPTGQLAMVLDGKVISAPTIETANFSADQIQIRGTFTESEAKDLARQLKYGALPIEFEQQQAQIVSATLGRDALHAGLVAGAVGLVLVTIYMIAFYRVLGVLSIFKLAIEGALLWAVISWLGTNNGLALTLAGVTGIVVSIGTSLDSNVVYYEHLKEDVLNGRTMRSATDKAFHSSFSTIVKADVASLIGALLLWWLTIGPVRGFALYLALSTLLDLLCSWAYMRPVVRLATRSKLAQRPTWLGIPKHLDAPADEPAPPARPTAGATR